MTDKRPFDTLLFDITYAIAKSINTPKKFMMENAEPLAKDIIAHLEQSGWLFDRKPPAKPHATTG